MQAITSQQNYSVKRTESKSLGALGALTVTELIFSLLLLCLFVSHYCLLRPIDGQSSDDRTSSLSSLLFTFLIVGIVTNAVAVISSGLGAAGFYHNNNCLIIMHNVVSAMIAIAAVVEMVFFTIFCAFFFLIFLQAKLYSMIGIIIGIIVFSFFQMICAFATCCCWYCSLCCRKETRQDMNVIYVPMQAPNTVPLGAQFQMKKH